MKFYEAGYFRFEPEGKAYLFLTNGLKFRAGRWYSIAAENKHTGEATSYGIPLLFVRPAFLSGEKYESGFYKTIVRAQAAEMPKHFREPENPIVRAWFNDVAGSTIVEFSDGKKIEVQAENIDKYTRGSGVAWALLKKTCGSGSEMQEFLDKLGATF